MQRADRLLLGAALAFGALVSISWWRQGASAPREVSAAAPALDVEAELALFLEELAAFRAGDPARLSTLFERARSLCEHHQRCEALDIAGYYAALDARALAQGLADEARVLALRKRASAAERAELDPLAWQNEREQLCFQLEELADSSTPLGDRVPAAQALALAAHLRVEHLRRAGELDPAERARELAALKRDLERSLEIFVRAGMLRPRIELDWIRGLCAREAGRSAEAEQAEQRCLDGARRVGEKLWQERALRELHALAEEQGDLPRLESLVDELAALEAPALSWSVVQRHASLLIARDRPELAASFLAAHPPGASEADPHALLLGSALLRAGRIEEARAEYARIDPSSPQASRARLAEAQTWLARGAAAEALARIERAEPPRRAALDERGLWLSLRGEALLALNRPAQAIPGLREALELAGRAQTLGFGERPADATTNVFGEVLGLHAVELLARAELESGDALAAACSIESAQASSLRLARGGTERWSLARGDLAAWARHFELGLATWAVGANETLVVRVEADGSARGARIAHGRREIEEAVRRLREALLCGDERRREALTGELAAVLLPGELAGSIAARAGSRSARLGFLLHGPLEALPIEAFEDGAWLAPGLVPVVLPGLPADAPAPDWDAARDARWRLLGDPLGERGQSLLPAAREELDEIARLWPDARRASGADFDRAHLADALRSSDCLHLATHVLRTNDRSAARSEDASLLVSGGALFPLREIAALHPCLPLAVLTACETGGGRFADAEGLFGLARAFLEGGTRNLVVTSWPVEDRWARAFAVQLQRGLAGGLLPSRAAAEARRSLRAQGASAAEWAAFRLLGQD